MNKRDREELATLISTSLDGIFGTRDFGPATQDFKLAHAILAAGYTTPAEHAKYVRGAKTLGEIIYEMRDELADLKAPRTITTVEQLDALPAWTVVRSEQATIWEKFNDRWAETMSVGRHPSDHIALPATVLYTPEESK